MNGERGVLFKLPGDDVGENFEFTVRVGAEASAGGNTVFVDDTEGAKLIVLAILIPIRREDQFI